LLTALSFVTTPGVILGPKLQWPTRCSTCQNVDSRRLVPLRGSARLAVALGGVLLSWRRRSGRSAGRQVEAGPASLGGVVGEAENIAED